MAKGSDEKKPHSQVRLERVKGELDPKKLENIFEELKEGNNHDSLKVIAFLAEGEDPLEEAEELYPGLTTENFKELAKALGVSLEYGLNGKRRLKRSYDRGQSEDFEDKTKKLISNYLTRKSSAERGLMESKERPSEIQISRRAEDELFTFDRNSHERDLKTLVNFIENDNEEKPKVYGIESLARRIASLKKWSKNTFSKSVYDQPNLPGYKPADYKKLLNEIVVSLNRSIKELDLEEKRQQAELREGRKYPKSPEVIHVDAVEWIKHYAEELKTKPPEYWTVDFEEWSEMPNDQFDSKFKEGAWKFYNQQDFAAYAEEIKNVYYEQGLDKVFDENIVKQKESELREREELKKNFQRSLSAGYYGWGDYITIFKYRLNLPDYVHSPEIQLAAVKGLEESLKNGDYNNGEHIQNEIGIKNFGEVCFRIAGELRAAGNEDMANKARAFLAQMQSGGLRRRGF